MSTSVRPQTTFAVALLAAGVVSAASMVSAPAHPTISVDVANASAITDVLASLGKSVEVASSLVGIHVDATISVPFEATLAVMAAQQHPELAGNVLSYLVQRFVNPAVGAPITAYPFLTEQTAALVASLLPYPLGPSATDIGLVNEARFAFADVFNSVLGQLPDPLPGYHAVQDVMNNTALGGAVVAGQLAARAPLYMAWSAANYLGNLPVNVEASLEQAIQTPDQIPGLVSNLVYGLLSPDAKVGLFGQLLDNVVDPFTWLPAPIGFGSTTAVGLANQVRAVVADVVNRVLALLPAPVTPSALPVPTAPGAQPPYAVDAGKGAVTTDPAPSMATTTVEKSSEATSLAAKAAKASVAEGVAPTAVTTPPAEPKTVDDTTATVTESDTATATAPATAGEADTSAAGDANAGADADADVKDPATTGKHDAAETFKDRTIRHDQTTPGKHAKTEPTKTGTEKSEPSKTEPSKAEPSKAEPERTEPKPADTSSKGDSSEGAKSASSGAAA
jgi:hypothetical protein